MKDNKNKNKIIGISIGILVVLLVVISSTYAYWQITKSQKDPNSIVAACLDFNVDFPVGINEDNAWPISNAEGLSQDGYTFTVTNNCPEDVSYVVGLESVTSDRIGEYLKDESIALAFDKEYLGTYGSLTNLQGPSADARGSKELRTSTVKGKSDVEGENVNTHNLKIWIDENSDVTEQGRGFAAKLFITGGQGVENDNPSKLTADACFEMDGNEIIGYDESCGESVVIPSTVNGVAVKTIDTDAFKGEVATTRYYDSSFNEIEYFDASTADFATVMNNFSDSDNSEQLYHIIFTTDATKKAAAEEILSEFSEPIYYADVDEIPTFNPDDFIGYMAIDDTGTDYVVIGGKHLSVIIELAVESLDLSQAYNLEKIEKFAFSNVVSMESYIEDPDSVPVGLTNLVFSNTDKPLALGAGAFAKSNLEELTTYTNLAVPAEFVEKYDEANGDLLAYAGPFAFSNINNLNVLPNVSNESIYTELYPGGIGEDSVAESALYLHISSINKVTLGEGITSIPALAFFSTNITINELNLPDTLESIGDGAFMGTKNIKNLVLSDNIKHIGSVAFSSAGIETVSMPKSLETIGRAAFHNNDIKTIEFYEGLTTIGERTFTANSNLTSVIIPSSIKEIGSEAFKDATGTITMVGRSDLTGLTLGTNWKGNATIVYEIN